MVPLQAAHALLEDRLGLLVADERGTARVLVHPHPLVGVAVELGLHSLEQPRRIFVPAGEVGRLHRGAIDRTPRPLERGASVAYADPHVPEIVFESHALKAVEATDARLAEADCVVILTDHPEFDYARIVQLSSLVVDTRGATHRLPTTADRVVAL